MLGLCWSRAPAEDAGPVGATEDAAARSGPGCTAGTGLIPSACELCLALPQNSPEMEQRALSHALWFQLIRKSRAGRRGEDIAVCLISPPSGNFFL